MLCYKLQSLGGKCPNSALKLKFRLSGVFDKLIAGLLISPCSFRVLPDDCSLDGFFAKHRPCLTAVSLRLIVSMSIQYAHSVPSALLLNTNLSFACLLGIQLRGIVKLQTVKYFSPYKSLCVTTAHIWVVWFYWLSLEIEFDAHFPPFSLTGLILIECNIDGVANKLSIFKSFSKIISGWLHLCLVQSCLFQSPQQSTIM